MNGWAGYLVTGEKVNIFTLFWCHPLHIHAPPWLAHLTVPAPILTLQPRMGRLCSQCLPLFRPRTSPQLSFLAPADIKLQCLFWQQPACVLGLFDWKAKYSDCRKKHDLGLAAARRKNLTGGEAGNWESFTQIITSLQHPLEMDTPDSPDTSSVAKGIRNQWHYSL